MAHHPNLDPGLAAALEATPLPFMDFGALRLEDLPGVRVQHSATRAAMAPLVADERVTIEDRTVPGPDGDPDVRLRIYRPAGQDGPLPGLYWIHGGGMILGEVEMEDPRLIDHVLKVGCVIVSVDYRLAPEHPDPAPVEDCYAGLVWTAKNAADLGIAPDRLAVGGLSAGGGLAAGTVLLARDRGGPPLVFQLLVCPMLDDRNTTPSSREFTDAIVWDRAANILGWTALLGDRRGGDDVSPYAAPARATDLSGLPPAYIDVGELEVFRDECADYALRLVQAGVSTEFHLYPGAFHGFDGLFPQAEISRRAAAERVVALRRALFG
ncbi:acetyl esterase/lipase [Streptosporangium becharense]|uniref:Acetyl esterase/lipase n=1 Tax=Streptosporangium becharense TaxID=1816182 RepID=A0A7W9MKB0_9ACTN|nr:alpha/beta hydrolase [Streptosporangium becharense]MBB2910561.1 acetyl esterase/lipase [Streptosporangium becharense]MBB5823304.1 acetyl esterase/lipase [Streptosporangium becharense]